MNEFELIARLTRSLPSNKSVVVGAGDDCAVLDVGLPDRLLLFKTDAVVERVHFEPGVPPEKIGHKPWDDASAISPPWLAHPPPRSSPSPFPNPSTPMESNGYMPG